jgi:hypothetical protein
METFSLLVVQYTSQRGGKFGRMSIFYIASVYDIV